MASHRSPACNSSAAPGVFQEFLDALPLGVHRYRLSDDGRLVFVGANPAASRILGFDCSRFVGLTIEEAFPPLVGTDIPEAYHNVAKSGIPWHTEQVTYSGGAIQGAFEVDAFRTGADQMAALFTEITDRKRNEAVVAGLLRAASRVGAEFFPTLVQELAAAFGARYAFVGRLVSTDPGRVRTVALCANGAIAPNFEYELAGTPCANVVGRSLCFYPDGVQELFPEDRLLRDLCIASYLGSPVFDSDQRPLGLVALMHTERILESQWAKKLLQIFADRAGAELQRAQAHEELARGKDLLTQVMETAPVGITLVDGTGHVTFANAAAQESLGLTLDEVTRRTYNGQEWRIARLDGGPFPDEELPFRRVMATGQPVRDVRHAVEVPGRHRVLLSINAAPVLGERREPTGMVAAIEDITQKVAAEEALQKANRRQQALFESARDAIFLADPDTGRILDANRAAEALLGRPRSEIVGLHQTDLHPAEEGARYRQLFEDRSGGARPGLIDAEVVTARGRRVPVEISDNLVDLGDGTKVVLGIFRDVTERKLAEERMVQAQKMESVGRLAGGIAHDFNNLLTVIIGYSDVLLGQPGNPPDVSAKLQGIHQAADRAAELTGQLLAFSRKQIRSPRSLDLNTTVGESVSMLQRLIGEDIEVVTRLSPQPAQVVADRSQMTQVILNLAVNARDAMPSGGTLTMETALVDLDDRMVHRHPGCPPGTYVLLAVSDTGVGMSRETLSHVFEPFFTTKEQGKGTGLGLATVYGIVQQNGGFVWVYSEPEMGSTFKVYLPQAAEPPKTLDGASGHATQRGTETILVVEDEEHVRALLLDALSSQGFHVLSAATPEEALGLAASLRGPLHLLVTDVVLPHMNGTELAQRLTLSRPDLRVLYVSGYAEDAIVHRGVLDDNNVKFLPKPFRLHDLLRTVREALGATSPAV